MGELVWAGTGLGALEETAFVAELRMPKESVSNNHNGREIGGNTYHFTRVQTGPPSGRNVCARTIETLSPNPVA